MKNEGYSPRAPQVGDLVQDSAMGHGVVIMKRGLIVRVVFFKNTSKPVWVTRTQVLIQNRSAR
jgi:hypothetical protein